MISCSADYKHTGASPTNKGTNLVPQNRSPTAVNSLRYHCATVKQDSSYLLVQMMEGDLY